MSSDGPKNVLLLLSGAFGLVGGIEMYNRLVIKAFHELMREEGGVCETLLLTDADRDVDTRYLDPTFSRPLTFSSSRPRFVLGAIERVTRARPDLIVVGHVNFGSLALALRALRPGAAQWFITHGVDVWRRLPSQHRLAIRNAERVMSVSDFTRRELVRLNGVDSRGVHLLPCALDPLWAAEFEHREDLARPDPARPLLLTVARLAESERYKGIAQVIRALPIIARQIPGIRYAIIGDGADRPRIEGVARELGVEGRVEFRGRVSAAALANGYSECSLFVMPSAKEGFGIVFLEASLFSKASIGGNHGGTPEVVSDGETGRLVCYGDVDGLATVAIEMLSAREKLAEMGERARQRLEARFTYAAFRERLRVELRDTAPHFATLTDARRK